MELDYFELVRKALEYLKAIGGICVFCENAEVIYISGSVKCKKLGNLILPALRCIHYIRKSEGEIKAEEKEGIQ